MLKKCGVQRYYYGKLCFIAKLVSIGAYLFEKYAPKVLPYLHDIF